LKRRLDSGSRATLNVAEDPEGRERVRGASLKAVHKPKGGWPPGRGGVTGGGKPQEGQSPRGDRILWVGENPPEGVPDSRDGKPRGRAGGLQVDPPQSGPPRSAQQAGSQRRGGDGPRKRHQRTWKNKPLKGEAQERSGLQHDRQGSRGANRREGQNPEGGT
jgi:hypothetical protein